MAPAKKTKSSKRKGWGKKRARKYFKRYKPYCINGSSKSRATVKCNGNWSGSIAVVPTATRSQPLAFNPVITQTGLMTEPTMQYWLGTCVRAGSIWGAYSRLYQQFKIEYVKVEITFDASVSDDLVGTTLYCAIDRTCPVDQLFAANTYTQQDIFNNGGKGYTYTTNRSFKYTRKVKPTDLLEKNTWFETAGQQTTGYVPGDSQLTKTLVGPHTFMGMNNFCPTFYMFLERPVARNASISFPFTLTYTVYLTFRNPCNIITAINSRAATVEASRAEHEELDDAEDEIISTQLLEDDDDDVIKLPKKKSKTLGADDSSKVKAKAAGKTKAPEKIVQKE